MNPGRNDPCPCGSGKKYKKCCGAVISINAAPDAAARRGGRSCGECTACCDGWVAGEIRGHVMKPGVPCHFVRAGGCSIYEERPVSPCRKFVCGWLAADSPFPEEFRPDKLGVIVIRIAWRDRPAYLLTSAGRDPDERLLDWMRAFSVQTGRPFFYEQAGEKLGFGPAAFQQDMLQKAERGEAMW
jgi:hypothetical protein